MDRIEFWEAVSTACEECGFLDGATCTVPGKICWKRKVEGRPEICVGNILKSLELWES